MSQPSQSPQEQLYAADSLRLEGVVTCVGFDDVLDFALSHNRPHLDNLIVVTSHEDHKTKLCAAKHNALCVPTDLFKKNGRSASPVSARRPSPPSTSPSLAGISTPSSMA